MTWDEYRRLVRAHRPSELLAAVAAASAARWTPEPLQVDPAGPHPWVLASIARESLAWGNEHRAAPVGPGTLARLHDAYMNLDDPFLQDDSALDALVRIVYEQGEWQGEKGAGLKRMGALFDRDFGPEYEVLSRENLRELLGADPSDYFGVCLLAAMSAKTNAGWFEPAWLDQPHFARVVDVVPADLIRHVFTGALAGPYAQVAEAARAGRHAAASLRRFDPNPLRSTPYVQMRPGAYLAPVTDLVAQRASLNGVYFLGIGKWGDRFTRDIGRLVEAYAGEQLRQLEPLPGVRVEPERPYSSGQGGSKTVDWLLVLPGLVLLIEVKAARVNSRARFDFDGFKNDVLARAGKGLKQIAASARLLRDRHTVYADIPSDVPVRGIVVTAEPHFLLNAPTFREGQPDPTVPTVFMSLEEFEDTVAHALADDPVRVFGEVTDWRDDGEGVYPDRVLALLVAEAGRASPPRNPILDAAWDRYPFRPEPDSGDGSERNS